MRRPGKLGSRRGLLLLEAVLSAVVIAVGLSLVTRALGGQLGAVRRVEEVETTLGLARSTLLECEALASAGLPLKGERGVFDAPWTGYRWRMRVASRRDGERASLAEATVTAERDGPPAFATSLDAVWPSTWVPQ